MQNIMYQNVKKNKYAVYEMHITTGIIHPGLRRYLPFVEGIAKT
jgi:hypothetical protein